MALSTHAIECLASDCKTRMYCFAPAWGPNFSSSDRRSVAKAGGSGQSR